MITIMETEKDPKTGALVEVGGRKGRVVSKNTSHGEDPYNVYSVRFNDNETRNYSGDEIDKVYDEDTDEEEDEEEEA